MKLMEIITDYSDKKPIHTCSMCQKKKNDVRLVIDPYDKEINEKEIKRWLCRECEQERRDNI